MPSFHLNVPLYPGCLSWSLFGFWEITKRAVKPRGYGRGGTGGPESSSGKQRADGRADGGAPTRPILPGQHDRAYGATPGGFTFAEPQTSSTLPNLPASY